MKENILDIELLNVEDDNEKESTSFSKQQQILPHTSLGSNRKIYLLEEENKKLRYKLLEKEFIISVSKLKQPKLKSEKRNFQLKFCMVKTLYIVNFLNLL